MRGNVATALNGGALGVIGTSDLTAEMARPGQYDDPRVRAAYERTLAAYRTHGKHGKHVGIGGLASRPDLIAEYVKMGARYVSTGTDLAFLMGTCVLRIRPAIPSRIALSFQILGQGATRYPPQCRACPA